MGETVRPWACINLMTHPNVVLPGIVVTVVLSVQEIDLGARLFIIYTVTAGGVCASWQNLCRLPDTAWSIYTAIVFRCLPGGLSSGVIVNTSLSRGDEGRQPAVYVNVVQNNYYHSTDNRGAIQPSIQQTPKGDSLLSQLKPWIHLACSWLRRHWRLALVVFGTNLAALEYWLR